MKNDRGGIIGKKTEINELVRDEESYKNDRLERENEKAKESECVSVLTHKEMKTSTQHYGYYKDVNCSSSRNINSSSINSNSNSSCKNNDSTSQRGGSSTC